MTDFQTTVTNEQISQLEKEIIETKAKTSLLKGLIEAIKQ